MNVDSSLSVRASENSAYVITAKIIDENGAALGAASLTTLTLTLHDHATGAIINSVDDVNILNVGRGTVDASGNLVITLTPSDNVIVGSLREEMHVANIEWTYAAGVKSGRYAIGFVVEDFTLVFSAISLTIPQVDEFRTTYIRDRWVAADGVNPAIGLSAYNLAFKRAFFSDHELETLYDRLQVDYAEELQGVYNMKETERIDEGDSEAVAATSAAAEQKQALFRLLRAECRELMMADPGFYGSIADKEHRGALFKTWEVQISKDRTFARTRSSSAFASVQLVRL